MNVTLALDHARSTVRALEAALLERPEAPFAAPGLTRPEAFYAALKASAPFGPTLTQAEVDGCNRILKACDHLPVSHAAYVLATAFHETAGMMAPRREIGRGQGRAYGKPGRNGGQIAYGRGDVQLTWDDNYERADRELGLGGRLIADYDLALDPEISARILVRGMTEGWFHKAPAKGLASYLPPIATAAQFAAARATVNGSDRAELIAGYAVAVQAALLKGEWQQ